jgi:hypothetical protein
VGLSADSRLGFRACSRSGGKLGSIGADRALKYPATVPERRCSQMLNLKSKAAFLAVPAVLALAAVSYGSVVAFSAANPTPAPAAEAAEAPEAAEAAEANEPALPGGGYADADNVNADTQQEGIH